MNTDGNERKKKMKQKQQSSKRLSFRTLYDAWMPPQFNLNTLHSKYVAFFERQYWLFHSHRNRTYTWLWLRCVQPIYEKYNANRSEMTTKFNQLHALIWCDDDTCFAWAYVEPVFELPWSAQSFLLLLLLLL